MSMYRVYSPLAETQGGAWAQTRPFVGYSVVMDVRGVAAANLHALIYHAKAHHRTGRDRLSLATAAGVSPSTVGRIMNLEQAPGIDTLDALARVYGLRAWQLLIPNLDPANPPVLPCR